MSRPCGLWQRKLPFEAGMGSASTTPVLRWWSSGQVGGSSATSAAVAADNGRPWRLASPPARSAVGPWGAADRSGTVGGGLRGA